MSGSHEARFQPVQASAHRPLGQAGIADQRGHGRERARPVRPGVVGQADEDELARARWLAAAVGRGRTRLSAHEIASTLTGHRLARARPGQPSASSLSQFVSHSPPSGAVHWRTRATALPRLGTLAAGGGWDCAILESVRHARLRTAFQLHPSRPSSEVLAGMQRVSAVRFWERNGSGSLPSGPFRCGLLGRREVADLRGRARTELTYTRVPCSYRGAQRLDSHSASILRDHGLCRIRAEPGFLHRK